MMDPKPLIVPDVKEPVPPLESPATSVPPPPQPVISAMAPAIPNKAARRVHSTRLIFLI